MIDFRRIRNAFGNLAAEYASEIWGGSGQPGSGEWGVGSGEWGVGSGGLTDYLSQKYTGEERDQESVLDHFPAQSWNIHRYGGKSGSVYRSDGNLLDGCKWSSA